MLTAAHMYFRAASKISFHSCDNPPLPPIPRGNPPQTQEKAKERVLYFRSCDEIQMLWKKTTVVFHPKDTAKNLQYISDLCFFPFNIARKGKRYQREIVWRRKRRNVCGERGGGGILMEGKGEGRRCSSAETQDEGKYIASLHPFRGGEKGASFNLVWKERRRKTL